MATLTKAALADVLIRDIGVSQQEAKRQVDHFFNELKLILATGYDVKLSGFGNFCLTEKSARPGRNPRTGQEVTVSARRIVSFKAGNTLIKKINQQK